MNNVLYYYDMGELQNIFVKKDDVIYGVEIYDIGDYNKSEYGDTILAKLLNVDTTYEAMNEIFQFEN